MKFLEMAGKFSDVLMQDKPGMGKSTALAIAVVQFVHEENVGKSW